MLEDIDKEPIELVFIRAPYITTVGSNVTILKKGKKKYSCGKREKCFSNIFSSRTYRGYKIS